MSKATHPFKLLASLKAAAARLAKEDGVSLNQRIATAVAQKVGAVGTATEFFRGAERAPSRATCARSSRVFPTASPPPATNCRRGGSPERVGKAALHGYGYRTSRH